MTLFDFMMVLAAIVGLSLLIAIIMLAYLLRSIDKRIEQDLTQALAQVRPLSIGLVVEQEYGIYYCYNSHNKEFVCQGSTIDELREAFRARFPNHTAYIAGGEESVIELLREAINKEKHEVSSSQ